MPNITVTVKDAYPPGPGKKRGAVIDVTGQRYSVPEIMLGQFQKGKSYDISYEDKEFQGHAYRDLQSVKPSATQPVTMPAAGRVLSDADKARQGSIEMLSRHNWVGARLDAFIAGGSLGLAVTDLVEAGRVIADAHDAIFAPRSQSEAHPESAAEFQDQVPW